MSTIEDTRVLLVVTSGKNFTQRPSVRGTLCGLIDIMIMRQCASMVVSAPSCFSCYERTNRMQQYLLSTVRADTIQTY